MWLTFLNQTVFLYPSLVPISPDAANLARLQRSVLHPPRPPLSLAPEFRGHAQYWDDYVRMMMMMKMKFIIIVIMCFLLLFLLLLLLLQLYGPYITLINGHKTIYKNII